jgi:hypothetical protein
MKRLTLIIVILVAGLILLAEFTQASSQEKVGATNKCTYSNGSIVCPVMIEKLKKD